MAEQKSSESLPAVLVLGGCGMVGRNLVMYLIQNNLVRKVRVADKALPMTAYFHPSHMQIFEDPRVEHVHADLARDVHRDRAFAGERFDFVINLAAETKYGQPESVYDVRCTMLSEACGLKARDEGVRRFVEVSTGLVYRPQGRRASTEASEIAPWTKQSSAKLAAEEALRAIEGLDVVVLRPAFIYGPGDVAGLMPRITCAAAYVELGETMKFLWDAQMKINTVHVQDVCRAIWHATNFERVPTWSVWNLCDKNDTDQGKVNTLLSNIFSIRTGFVGTMFSNIARVRLTDVVNSANDRHLAPWSDLCARHNISATPLSPLISPELLSHNHLYLDGSAYESTGFSYEHPTVTEALLRESIYMAIEQGIFPPVVEGAPARIVVEQES